MASTKKNPKSVMLISYPTEVGPGERERALELGIEFIVKSGVKHNEKEDDLIRVDIPKGAERKDDADESDKSELNEDLLADRHLPPHMETIIPALQSASMFGGKTGLLMVDTQHLSSAENGVINELLGKLDPEMVVVSIVHGLAPRIQSIPLKKAVEQSGGEVKNTKRISDRDVFKHINEQTKLFNLSLDEKGRQALVARFGSDIGSINQAISQITEWKEVAGKLRDAAAKAKNKKEGRTKVPLVPVAGELILDRFTNIPGVPMWKFVDTVRKGKQEDALKMLKSILQYSHPLYITVALESEIEKLVLVESSSSLQELQSRWRGPSFSAKDYWKLKTKLPNIGKMISRLYKADLTLKSAPAEMHRIEMERLTVSFCRQFA